MLEVEKLSVTGKGRVPLLKEVSFEVPLGTCIGLTGASGSGKTTLIKAIMGVLDDSCRITSGAIRLAGNSISQIPQKAHRQLCGTTLGFIPQNPMTAFDRHQTIGKQMQETLCFKLKISPQAAEILAKESLEQVNLPNTGRILKTYPGKLSGGMLQRVTMAFLLAMRPQYIFADEPTSALDEANRDLLLELLQNQLGDCGILFLSHDAVALRKICQKILVMANGEIVESASSQKLFEKPQEDWTKAFVQATVQAEGVNWAWTKLK